uniref:Bardet-Biedl syndrome 2 protein homolog n=1 Tax=Panagrellus redivivus TaxID=6233 RepID=A0A7E4W0P8_PANRE
MATSSTEEPVVEQYTSKASFKNVFSFGFSGHVLPKGASFGSFDDTRRTQIVIATNTNKIVLQSSEAIFHVNENINVIKAIKFTSSDEHDVVVIGTTSSLLCYDVYRNKTVFHRQMPEGIRDIQFGCIDDNQTPCIIVACGSTIWGIDAFGSDVFWTALGDDINALAICDVDNDGKNELAVGTNGVEIKVLKHLSLLYEFVEGDPISTLAPISENGFLFALFTGTLGYYEGKTLRWRVKSKSFVVSFLPYPNDNSFVCVWKSGKIDARLKATGEIIAKTVSNGDVADAFLADLNNNGTPYLVVVNMDAVGREFVTEISDDDLQQQIREFGQKKHHLLEELRNYEKPPQSSIQHASIPSGTSLQSVMQCTVKDGLCLNLSLNNNVPIRAAVIFAEGVFESESLVIHPHTEESGLTTQICPQRQMATDLHIKVFAGPSSAKQMHVFEVNGEILKFATLYIITKPENWVMPEGKVTFNIGFRPDNMFRWLDDNFYINEREDELEALCNASPLILNFVDVVSKMPFQINIEESGQSTMYHDDIEVCGNVFQSLMQHLKIEEISSVCTFPASIEKVTEAINTMDDKYSLSEQLNADWANQSNVARECIIFAEDILQVRKLLEARKTYVRLAAVNREMVQVHTLRSQARKTLLENMKIMAAAIDHHSRLRCGSFASKLVTECKKAIATENMSVIPRFLQNGV